MILRKNHKKLFNLIQCKREFSVEQRNFLYENGYENYEDIKDMLFNGKFLKSKHKCGAIRLLFMLRRLGYNKNFLEILKQFIVDKDIEVRSYCFNLLVTIISESFRKVSKEFSRTIVMDKLLPMLYESINHGILADNIEMAVAFLGEFPEFDTKRL